VESADAIISYRTNPHVDQATVASEAADVLRHLLGGRRLHRAALRLPISPATVRLLTSGNGTYASAMRRSEAMSVAPIVSLSVVGGFVFSDTTKNGITVLAYGDEREACCSAVREIGQQIWDGRSDFEVALTSLDSALAAALSAANDPTAPAICLADVADNPGGGGPGNTTGVLEALLAAGTKGVLFGLFCDPEAAAACVAAGPGNSIPIVLNRNGSGNSKQLSLNARVISVGRGPVIGRRGAAVGRSILLGPSAAVQVDGVTLVITSKRLQCTDPAIFESFGLDIGRYRCVVIKSRGHFRAGFDEFFANEQILEVDAPGVTSPVLSRFAFTGLPRPIYPLDHDVSWSSASPLLV
jgi:microcystin degradation protein MlrC